MCSASKMGNLRFQDENQPADFHLEISDFPWLGQGKVGLDFGDFRQKMAQNSWGNFWAIFEIYFQK